MQDLVQRAITEDRQPKQGEDKGYDQRTDHKLADSAATGNTRQKQTNKG